MSDTPITFNSNGKMGWTYHPKQDVWVAWNQDTTKRIDKPDGFDVEWQSGGVTVQWVEEW